MGFAARPAAALVSAVLLLGACTSDECSSSASCLEPRGPAVSPSASAWQRIADAPAPARQEVAAALVSLPAERYVYVVGGLLSGGGATDAVARYLPRVNFWAQVEPLPVKVHHAMAAELGGKLVVMGGFVEDLGGDATNRVFILEEGLPWREGPRMRRARGAGAAVTVGGQVVVVGGISGGRHVGPVEIFDGTSWRDGAAIPSLRDHLGAATDGKLVYAAGGRRAGGHFATFDVYDPAADRWSNLPDMPTARSGIGTAFANGKIVTTGGEGPRMFPEVEAYDIATRRWTRLPDLAVPVHGVGLVGVEENVYALTGGIRVGLAPTRAAQVLAIG